MMPLARFKLPPGLQRARNKRIAATLAACALLTASSGCSHGGLGSENDPYPFTPQPATVALGSGVKLNAAPLSAADDPQLSRSGDPMVDSADPLVSPSQELAGGSRFSDARGLGDAGSTARTHGWYWVVGSIQSGEIAIAVNGTPVGRYSAHVDKEITADCHPGLNTLTFTHYPLLGSGAQECAAHLEIVNGNAAKGAPPLMVYDTTSDSGAATALPAATPPQFPQESGGSGVLSSTSADPAGDADTAADADNLRSDAQFPPTSSSSPYMDERAFSGD